MYNEPRASILWFFPLLMLSVYMWGYFWPAYIRRSNVSVPRDRDFTLELCVWALMQCWNASLKLCVSLLMWCWMCVSSFASETRASSSTSWHWSGAETGLRALRLDIAVVLRCGLRALRLSITVMQGCKLRALHLGVAWMALISLSSEVWILLSDDLSSIIFRQSTEFPLKFSKLRGWLGRVLKYFRLFFWQQALKIRLAIFWDTLSSILSGSWSSWVYC